MSENFDSTSSNDEISLKDLIQKIKEIYHYLLKKWVVILVVGLLGGILGFIYSTTRKTEYIARLTFAIQEKGGSGGLASIAGQFGVNLGGSSDGMFSSGNIIELLKSRNLIERTLLSKITIDNKEQNLIDFYINKFKIAEAWEKNDQNIISFPLNQNRNSYSREQDSVLNSLANGITNKNLIISKLSKETSMLEVKFVNRNEVFSKYFIDILVKEVLDFYIQSRTSVLQNNLKNMEFTADSIKKELDDLLLKRAVYADHNLDAVRQVTNVRQQKDQMQIQLLGTVYAEMAKNIELIKMDLIRETPLIQIIDKPILPLEKKKLGKIKGTVIGGFLGGFLIISYLLLLFFYKRIMEE